MPSVASDSCFWLRGLEADLIICRRGPPAAKFDALCVLRCFPTHHNWKEWLFELAILSSELSHQQGLSLIPVMLHASS